MRIGLQKVVGVIAVIRNLNSQQQAAAKRGLPLFAHHVVNGVRIPLVSLFLVVSWTTEASAAEQTVAFSFGEVGILGDGPSFLELGVGVFDFNQEGAGAISAASHIEFRYGEKLFFIGPAIGIMANTDGGVFGYGGIYSDIRYKDFVATPLLALGGYREGGSKDLGGVLQYRVGLSLTYQLDETTRVGVRVAHISNASIHEDNPGEEEIFLAYTFSF